HVARAVAENAISDVNVTALGVFYRTIHRLPPDLLLRRRIVASIKHRSEKIHARIGAAQSLVLYPNQPLRNPRTE
ncbi:MAG TPA: hypothetical protein VMI09_16660, partial [Candidatus Binataceae bacterium]|nr:hypothetical protein [Candidatus Binataceae bacterium]